MFYYIFFQNINIFSNFNQLLYYQRHNANKPLKKDISASALIFSRNFGDAIEFNHYKQEVQTIMALKHFFCFWIYLLVSVICVSTWQTLGNDPEVYMNAVRIAIKSECRTPLLKYELNNSVH